MKNEIEIMRETDTKAETSENTIPQEETERENVIKLEKPYCFEDKEYTEIDMRGLERLKIQDAIDAQRALFGKEVAANMLCETTTAFAREIATKATGLPAEFFKLAPRGVSKRIVAAVRGLLNSAEQETENHVMRFEKPYFFQGKQYEAVDLSGIALLNSMNESEAENRMAMEGFMITENSFNYLYACVLASMATKLPEDFFTGLPLQELSKLKNAVNDAGFFE